MKPLGVIRCATHGRNTEISFTVGDPNEGRTTFFAGLCASRGENDDFPTLPKESVLAIGGDIALDVVCNWFPWAWCVLIHDSYGTSPEFGERPRDPRFLQCRRIALWLMSSAAVFFSVVTALVMLASGAYDFTMPQKVLDLMDRLGHRPNFVRTLGLLKILGGLGLLVGLVFGVIGVLAALGLVAYFILAIRAHAKLGDSGAETLPAAAMFILSALTLITNLFA